MVFVALAVASGVYILLFYQDIVMRAGAPNTPDLIFGIIMVLLILEATRRATGWVLVIIAGAFLLYNFLGPYIPGLLGHKGYSIGRVISQMYLTTEGIFGVPLGVSANYIFLFIFLTSMLERLGMGDFLLRLAMALMGRFTGGPAKTAVLASGFMGSLNGSAVANVVGTGTFTIPLMKRNGYKPHFAGAVEACASSGGQLMPPIMGAAAFIIAEFLSIPYIEVVVAAIIPAALYYLCVLFGVHFEACRLGLTGLPKSELPSARKVLKEGWYFLVPLGVLVFFLAVLQYTPIRSGFYAIISMFIVSFATRESRISWERFRDGAVMAARNTITVALAAYAAAGIAKDEPMKIGITACKIGLAAFIVPFLFAGQPALIGVGDGWHIAWSTFTALIGVMALAGGCIGFVVRKALWWERTLLICGALLSLHPVVITDTIGLGMIVVALASNIMTGKKPVGKTGSEQFGSVGATGTKTVVDFSAG